METCEKETKNETKRKIIFLGFSTSRKVLETFEFKIIIYEQRIALEIKKFRVLKKTFRSQPYDFARSVNK